MNRAQRSKAKTRAVSRSSRSSSSVTSSIKPTSIHSLSSVAVRTRNTPSSSPSRSIATRSRSLASSSTKSSHNSSLASRSTVTTSIRAGHHEATENPIFKKGIFAHDQFRFAPNVSHGAHFQHPMNYQGDVPVTPTEFQYVPDHATEPIGPLRITSSVYVNGALALAQFGVATIVGYTILTQAMDIHPDLVKPIQNYVGTILRMTNPLPEPIAVKSVIDTPEFNRGLESFLEARSKAQSVAPATVIEQIQSPTSFPKIGVVAVDTPVDVVFTSTDAKHDV